jgi:hypothetical protein
MRRVLLPLVVMITPLADAHVSPSVDDNNRYVKVSPQADRVRVAYTVFFGEVPGAALRPKLDTNKDGSISDGEAQVFGDRIGAEVIGGLDLELDGKQQRVAWKAVSVGMGTPTVAAGSFSIDMIAYVCLARARGRHEVRLKDNYRVPKPGETEVRVEDATGITVELARIGGADALANDFKFVGPGGPLSDDGLRIVFVASDDAPLSNECDAIAAEPARIPWLAIGLGALAIAIGGIVIYKRRK